MGPTLVTCRPTLRYYLASGSLAGAAQITRFWRCRAGDPAVGLSSRPTGSLSARDWPEAGRARAPSSPAACHRTRRKRTGPRAHRWRWLRDADAARLSDGAVSALIAVARHDMKKEKV
jgi:hypothetical protein